MWYLDICFPNGETLNFDLSSGEVIIGRASDCGLMLDDLSISRYHAKISIGRIGIVIEDLQSSNGVVVNGRPVVDRIILRAGDEILLGNIKLNLLAGEDEERTMLFQPIEEEAVELPLTPEESIQQQHSPTLGKSQDEATAVGEAAKIRMEKEVSFGKGPTQVDQESTKITTLSEAEDISEEFIPKLLIFMEGEPKKAYPLYREHVNIGRAEENDVVIEHSTISRFHAKLIASEGSYTLIDLDSANGTMLNGLPIRKVALKNWDEIYFGSVRAKFAGKPQPVHQPMSTMGEYVRENWLTPRRLILLGLGLFIILLGFVLLG